MQRSIVVAGAAALLLLAGACSRSDTTSMGTSSTTVPATSPATSAATANPAGGGSSTSSVPATSPPSPPPSTDTISPIVPTTVVPPSGDCPGPDCMSLSISPSSGPAGSVITVTAVSGVCTASPDLAMIPTNPPGPSVASGELEPQGMSQYRGTITVPAGTKAGVYLVNSWSSAAQETAGICQQAFTVTG